MTDIEQIRSELSAELDALEFEVSTLDKVFQETNFFGHNRNFPNAHYGYLMVCMSKIDLMSLYWRGEKGAKQTERMTSFMDRYLHPGKGEENSVAVQMFRHTLMHTGELRFLYNKAANSAYTWRVHFGHSLPANLHYSITVEDERHQDVLRAAAASKLSGTLVFKALNIEIVRLASDLKKSLAAYLSGLETDTNLQSNALKVHPNLLIQEVRL